MRREDRVTVQGPVKKQQPDAMSHRGSEAPKSLCSHDGPPVSGPFAKYQFLPAEPFAEGVGVKGGQLRSARAALH